MNNFREINFLFTFFKKYALNASPGYNHCCPEGQIRSSIEQSHANLQNQQHHLKSQVCLYPTPLLVRENGRLKTAHY